MNYRSAQEQRGCGCLRKQSQRPPTPLRNVSLPALVRLFAFFVHGIEEGEEGFCLLLLPLAGPPEALSHELHHARQRLFARFRVEEGQPSATSQYVLDRACVFLSHVGGGEKQEENKLYSTSCMRNSRTGYAKRHKPTNITCTHLVGMKDDFRGNERVLPGEAVLQFRVTAADLGNLECSGSVILPQMVRNHLVKPILFAQRDGDAIELLPDNNPCPIGSQELHVPGLGPCCRLCQGRFHLQQLVDRVLCHSAVCGPFATHD